MLLILICTIILIVIKVNILTEEMMEGAKKEDALILSLILLESINSGIYLEIIKLLLLLFHQDL